MVRLSWRNVALLKSGIVILFVLMQAFLIFLKRHPTLVLDVHPNNTPSPRVFGDHEVGQTFIARSNDLFRIDLMIGTYMQTIKGDVVFRLSEISPERRIICEGAIKGPGIKDNLYQPVEFKPIRRSNGRKYELAVFSPDSTVENSVSLWMNSRDIYRDGELLIDGLLARGDLVFRAYAKRPVIAELGRIVGNYPGILGSRVLLVAVILIFEAVQIALLRMLLNYLWSGGAARTARGGKDA